MNIGLEKVTNQVRYEVNNKILTVLFLHCKHRRDIYRD